MATSAQIKDRMIHLINNNELLMDEELEVFEALFKKYDFRSIQGYADKNGKTYQGVKDMIKRRKAGIIEINNIKLCF